MRFLPLLTLTLIPLMSFAGPTPPDQYAHSVPPLPTTAYNAISQIPGSRIKLLEQAIFDRTNAIRAENNVPLLVKNNLLLAIARSHSQDMAIHHFFSHTGSVQDEPIDRVHMSGICGVAKDCAMNSENLSNTAWGNANAVLPVFGSDDDVKAQVVRTVDDPTNGLMADAGHRGNILDNRTEQMAVGISLSDDGTFYITQDFIRVTPLPANSN